MADNREDAIDDLVAAAIAFKLARANAQSTRPPMCSRDDVMAALRGQTRAERKFWKAVDAIETFAKVTDAG